MLKLHYTTKDIVSNEVLRNTAQTLLMVGWTHDWRCLCYDWDYVIDTVLLPFVQEYRCFIKMTDAQRAGEVFVWLPGREITNEDETESVLSFSERKLENFSDPLSFDGSTYVPSDIKNSPNGTFDWSVLQLFLDNACTIITIQEYQDIIIALSPDPFI